jgi:hypothetical protein
MNDNEKNTGNDSDGDEGKGVNVEEEVTGQFQAKVFIYIEN